MRPDLEGSASIDVKTSDWHITYDESGRRVSAVQVPCNHTLSFAVVKYDDGEYEATLSNIKEPFA